MKDNIIISLDKFDDAKNYWLDKLSGELEEVSLVTDFPATRHYKPAYHIVYLNKGESQKIIQVAKHNNLSLYILLVAAFKILLYLYTGQRDIIVTSPVYNASTQEYNKFVLLRDFLDTDLIFKELLMIAKQTVVEGYKNQFYPIEKILELLDTKGTRGMSFLKVILMLEAIHDRELPGNILMDCENYFVLVVSEEDQKLVFEVQYNSELFCAGTIVRLMDHYQYILKQVLDNTSIKINDIELMTWEEKREILEEFNNTRTEYPSQKTIQQLFEEQVKRTPNHIAVIGKAHCAVRCALTYRELNQKSNQLAYLVKEKGAQADTIVGIMVEHSLEMVIGILGILKAGGAYLPIDPDYPRERINYMLADSASEILVTTQDYSKEIKFEKETIFISDTINRVPTSPHLHLSTAPAIAVFSSTLTSTCQVSPTNLAYIIYTSGTTGLPKGVMVEHQCLVNYIWWAGKIYVKDEKIDFPLYTSISFDLTMTSIFTPLITGNAIVVYDAVDKELPIEKIIGDHKVGAVKLTPSHLKLIREKGTLHRKNSNIKRLIVGGEEFDTGLAQDIYKSFDENIEIYNKYGPTETTVGCMIHKFDPGTDKGRSVSIGSPADNTQIYLLDFRLKSVVVGPPGEICVAGDGVARGYLNKPEITDGKFVENPFSPGGRLYRTGDLARWLPDGNIEFLGRVDHQVKIRGFRIELGEIENQLLKKEEIAGAVVVAKEDGNAGKYLCAYIVADNELKPLELMEYLSTALPSYMVPSYFVQLEKMPLMTNGKINRKAVQELALDKNIDSGTKYVAPGNKIERLLVDIWEKVLGRTPIGINDSFFMIGGDSIKSIQISARMNRAGYKVEVRDIFQTPTIKKLAPLVKKMKRIASQDLITGEIPLTSIQEWFFSHQGIHHHHHNHAVMLHSQEGFDVEAIKTIFLKVQEHHDVLRMTYKRVKGKIIQYNHALDYPFSLQVVDLRKQEDALEVLEAKANEIQASFNLEKGPLMKLGLFHLDDGDRLLIIIHHLVIDGISWRILFEDFEVLHEQYKKGEGLSLPFKTDSYKLWSEKLLEYANSKQFLKEKEYWKKLESTPVPFIKVDMSEGDNYIKDSERVSSQLSEEETNDLLEKVNEAYNTEINDILLSALGLAIRECFGLAKAAINLEGHGREEIIDDIDISRTFGWFTSIYPVILDLSFANDLARQIKEVKEDLHRVPNRGIGYGILAYLTSTENKEEIQLKLKPQISFNYLGQFDADLSEKSFKIAGESPGNTICPDSERLHELVISGIITNNKLEMSIAYSNKRFKQETIRTFLNTYHKQLLHVINFCKDRDKTEATPSDMDYKGLTIDEFETIFE